MKKAKQNFSSIKIRTTNSGSCFKIAKPNTIIYSLSE